MTWPYLLVICRGVWALSWPRGEGSGWEGAATGLAPTPSHRRCEPRMQAQPAIFPQCPAALGCSSHCAESPPQASAHQSSCCPCCLAQGWRVKGGAIRAAGPSETTRHHPRQGRTTHQPGLSSLKTPEFSLLFWVPPVCTQTLPSGSLLPGHCGVRGWVGGLCRPVWNWVSRHLPRGGGLWGSHGCPVRTPLLLLRGSVSGPAESSPDNTSCARGAGPQSCPLTAGTSLRPVAQQPPGATRATAILISPRPPCFHCVSVLSPGSQEDRPRAAAALSPISGGQAWILGFSQPHQSSVQWRPDSGRP